MSEVTAADFQRLLVAQLRARGCGVAELRPLEIQIGVPGEQGHAVFHLAAMYQRFLAGALVGHLADALVRTLEEAGEAAPVEAELDLERLMPLLKPRTLLDEVVKGKVDAIAWRPFISDDLIVALVLDFPQSVRYVRESEAAGTGQGFDDLLEIALANLYERTEGELYELGDEQTGKMYILATQDGYDATRILLSPMLERLAARVRGELVIAIPNRDFFVAFGNASPLLVGQIGKQVRRDSQTKPYPLTSALFTFRNGQLEVYAPAEP